MFLQDQAPAPRSRRQRTGLRQTARVLVRLARARRRLNRIPTPGQIKAMAWFGGHRPSSYLLDPELNFVPEPLDFGYERELGTHALCFAGQDPHTGRQLEMVTMSDGGGFDLVASRDWSEEPAS